MEKKKKTCEGLFNRFNRWFENKEKTQTCLVGIKRLNSSRNTRIFTQQIEKPATLLRRHSNTGVSPWNF